MKQPRLTFFCELDPDGLAQLFADPDLIAHLQSLDASVSLGLVDLSPERAAIVRRLNGAGVQVVAWLLLPRAQGYWFNLDNVASALLCYAAFRDWTAQHGLEWAGVGLDIEPHCDEMALLMSNPRQLMPRLLGRLFESDSRVLHGEAGLDALTCKIRADGYRVDSYQLPFIVDERRAGSTLLRRLSGLADVAADREVLMLYSSFFRPVGPALLASYGRGAASVGVGSTGGGVDFGGVDRIEPLSWQELSADLRLAAKLTGDVHVFSLEGCARLGYLPLIASLDWDAPAETPAALPAVEWTRRRLRALLWMSKRPLWVLAGMTGALWLLLRLRRAIRG